VDLLDVTVERLDLGIERDNLRRIVRSPSGTLSVDHVVNPK
jgi:hypothetical protein